MARRWKAKPTGFRTVRGGDGWYVLPRNAGAAKPAGPKQTKGNRYTSPPPPKRGPGVANPAAPPRSPIPIDPYARYREKYPWAWAQLTDIDRAQQSHQQYAGQVGDWLSTGLRGLTGIDPNAPGYNPAVQQQYMANVAGQVGGALNAAASATPMQVAATTSGGIVQGNNAFLGQAAREAAAQRSSAAIQMSQAQSALNTMQPNTFAQGAMRAYADMQAGLPALYASRRSEARGKIDQFIMEFEEQKRHNRVSEAISAQNAQTQATLGFASLGLKADDQAFGQQQDLADAAAANAPAPYGYFRDADGDLVRDPSVPQASASGAGEIKQGDKYTRSWFVEKGWTKVPQGAGPAWKKKAVAAADGSGYWIPKSGSTGSTAKVPERRSGFNLAEDLNKQWPDVELRFDNNPEGAGKWLANWVREYKKHFISSGRAVDMAKLNQVLAQVGGRPAKEAKRILKGYMKLVNGKLVWK